jgi:hypothetical protein
MPEWKKKLAEKRRSSTMLDEKRDVNIPPLVKLY